MTRLSLVLAVAATAAVTMVPTAEARDGCGRGFFYNGYRCVPSDAYGQPYGYRGYYGGNVVRPSVGRNGQISCGNPNYTWQDGACKPYRGR